MFVVNRAVPVGPTASGTMRPMEWLAEFDRAMFLAINRGLRSEYLNSVFWLITSLGLGYIQAAALLLGRFVSPAIGRKAFVPGLAAFALSGIVSQVIKRLVDRDRPTVMFPDFAAPDEFIRYHSFPSGHTITSFAIASVVAIVAVREGNRAIGWFWLAVAALVGVSRIYRGVHWPTDVLASAVLGAFFGVVCEWTIRRRVSNTATTARASDL